MENQEQITTTNQQVMSVGDWIITLILMYIPIVGFIMLLIWAFGSNTPVNKANFAKAGLILMVIGAVISILFGGAIVAAMMAAFM